MAAEKVKVQFTGIGHPGQAKAVKGCLAGLKISARKKRDGLYATTICRGSQWKGRKYIGTIILDAVREEDPCFGVGKTRTDVGKLRKLALYGPEPKTTDAFDVQAAGGNSPKDLRKVMVIKSRYGERVGEAANKSRV
ncbi:hypothetical protein E9229_000979 [Paeniglutamicibacter cryotolerans]|uniref:Uncharacterized protein n=1 Tax=Paeniglutamicibacter cryotolerans TaxID=670079 RepID=A0A839QET9_9MICC|nr:hypothetical protein [Paeniglutamicibacter cryotolerans]